MRVRQRCAGRRPVVLENVDVLEARILVEIENALAVGGEDLRHAADGEVLQRGLRVGRLDDDLMRADAADAVVETLRLGVELALDAQRGITVGHYAHAPARLVRLGLLLAQGEDFRRREAFVALGEGIERGGRKRGRGVVLRSALAFRREDNPGVVQRIAAEFRRHTRGSKSAYGIYATASASS